jgi:Transglycosylase SLT domain
MHKRTPSSLRRNPGLAVAFVALASFGCSDGAIGGASTATTGASGPRSSGVGGNSGGSGSDAKSGAAGSGLGSSGNSDGLKTDAGPGGASPTPTSSGSDNAVGLGADADAVPTEGSVGVGDAGGCMTGTDPLKTGNPGMDAYDCLLMELAAKYGHPDPMMVKAQVQTESGFNVMATSPDSPCGSPAGWSDPESKSFGLIQVTPACGEAKPALLPNGHPNLDKDMQSPLWATSIFNPVLNLDEGFNTITGSLRSLQAKYSGCTAPQYVAMSAGAFNSGDDSVSGCDMYNARAQGYVNAVLGHYRTFAQSSGWPNPY